MGIYIKDMEMPETCGDCNFLHESMWKGKMYPCVCSAGGFVVKPSETDLRDGLCPLVESAAFPQSMDFGQGRESVLDEIRRAPTVDAEPVVRCKECKHWNRGRCWGIPFSGDDASYIETEANDFCSYGERGGNEVTNG